MKRRDAFPRRRWTPAEDETLRAKFPHMRTRDLAAEMGRSYSATAQRAIDLGVKKSDQFLASAASGRLQKADPRGAATRFQKGQRSWNKGTHYQPGGRCAETQFKPGNRPATWYPVGSEVLDCDGYLRRKVRDDAEKGMSRRNWAFVHRLVWEQHHGPIPQGHLVVFRNGNNADISIENLELVTPDELMRRNTIHNLPRPIAELCQLKGVLKRQITMRSRRHGE